MSKVKPTTKEQLVYYLSTNISLGTYDKRFISNLITMYVTPNKPVTTNQNELLEKIVLRYSRQLAKQEISADEMNKLSWTLTPIQSSPKYTEAHLSIVDDNIELRSPFKSEFIKQFREIPYVNWNRELKTWMVPYCEESLFVVTKIVNKHYNTVNYDTNVKHILEQVSMYEDIKYWAPTLVKTNNKLYVMACNESLLNAIKDIELSDDYHIICRLIHHGINIDESVYKDSSDIDLFLKVMNDNPSFDIHSDELIKYLVAIKTDFVLIREWQFGENRVLYSNLKKNLTENNIPYEIVERRKNLSVDLKNYKLPIAVGNMSTAMVSSNLVAKTITLTNSNEITIQ